MIGLDELRRLWPHREHESNWFRAAICRLGFHRWYRLEVPVPKAILSCSFCLSCSEVKVHGSRPDQRSFGIASRAR